MDDQDKVLFDELALLLFDWVERTADLVERSASDLDLRAEDEWAAQAVGEAGWAFEMLNQSLQREELLGALRVVFFWGMGGLLHASLNAIDRQSQFADRFTTHLRTTGHVPFVTGLPPGHDADQPEPDEGD